MPNFAFTEFSEIRDAEMPGTPINSLAIHRCLSLSELRTVSTRVGLIMSESAPENGPKPTSLVKKIVALILGLGAVSGALLSAYSLYDKFDPEPPPPPEKARGEIPDVTFENNKGGIKVRWKATVEGYKGKPVNIRWTLYDAVETAPVSKPIFGMRLEPHSHLS